VTIGLFINQTPNKMSNFSRLLLSRFPLPQCRLSFACKRSLSLAFASQRLNDVAGYWKLLNGLVAHHDEQAEIPF